MCRHADAASEVSHDDVHVLVYLSAGLGIATCGSLSVKGVEDRFALHERQSGVAGACHHLVYHHGVGHECRTTALSGYVVGYKTTEIAHVLMFGMMQVVLHKFVDSIHAAVQWLQQSAASYHGIELQWYSGLAQQLQYEILAVFILFVDGHELVYLFLRMESVVGPHGFVVLVYCHLG